MSVKLNSLLLNSMLVKESKFVLKSTETTYLWFLLRSFSLIGKGCICLKVKQKENSNQTFPCLTEDLLRHLIKIISESQ